MSGEARREFLSRAALVAGGAMAVAVMTNGMSVAAGDDAALKCRIVGLSGSPRRGMTTASGIRIALEAAQSVAPDRITTEFIELIDYPLGDARLLGEQAPTDTSAFSELEEKLAGAAGFIIGSPVHNSGAAALVTLFFGQVTHSLLQGKVGAALSVGGTIRGGQENVVQVLNTFMMHEGMILPGTGTAGRTGAFCQSKKDSLDDDDYGRSLAVLIGQRVATVALALPFGLLTVPPKE